MLRSLAFLVPLIGFSFPETFVTAGKARLAADSEIAFCDSDGNVESSINADTIPGINDLLDSVSSKVASLEQKVQDLISENEVLKDKVDELETNSSTWMETSAELQEMNNLRLLDAIATRIVIPVANASASTEYNQDYRAMNAFDEDDKTQWSSNNQGVNFWIEAEFEKVHCIGSFDFLQRPTSFHTKDIKLEFIDSMSNDLPQVYTLSNTNNVNTFEIQPVCTKKIRITAISVYKYLNNGASTIKFYGVEPLAGLSRFRSFKPVATVMTDEVKTYTAVTSGDGTEVTSLRLDIPALACRNESILLNYMVSGSHNHENQVLLIAREVNGTRTLIKNNEDNRMNRYMGVSSMYAPSVPIQVIDEPNTDLPITYKLLVRSSDTSNRYLYLNRQGSSFADGHEIFKSSAIAFCNSYY